MKIIISALYLLGMVIYNAGLAIASLFYTKARLLYKGRRNTWRILKNYNADKPCVWIHSASMGEFEQARPIIEAIREQQPDRRIVLTFYSPSGYEVRKNYQLADVVCYLPSDTPWNACHFIKAINPDLAIFIKYEYWHFFLNALRSKKIRTLGASMILDKAQPFFKWYGAWFRDMLHCFEHLYIQDKNSAQLLESIGVKHYTIAGDTRFDRVKAISESSKSFPLIEEFVKNAPLVFVAGSTWPPDEDLIVPFINNPDNNIKLIIASHEIDNARVQSLKSRFTVNTFLYTEPIENPSDAKVLIINTMGMLSAIYKYGQIAYVGGGFGKGIHNTLEPATYGIPVLFGPKHTRFKEALDLIACGGGFAVTDNQSFTSILTTLINDKEKLSAAGHASDEYVKSMCGATKLIMSNLN